MVKKSNPGHMNRKEQITDEDIRDVLKTLDCLLNNLPEKVIEDYIQTKEFALYEKVMNSIDTLEKESLLNDEDLRSVFINLDTLLEMLPEKVIEDFVQTEEFSLYAKVIASIKKKEKQFKKSPRMENNKILVKNNRSMFHHTRKWAKTKKIASIALILIIVSTVLFFVVDADGDELNNLSETQHGTAMFNSDSDSDGLSDGKEINVHGTNPLDSDCDSDNVPDGTEVNLYSTDPLSSDSDNDGLDDYVEIYTYRTNPLRLDSDSDSLNDKDEVDTYGSNPLSSDSDSDGLDDKTEADTYHTDPINSDSDSDGLDDYKEIFTYNTNPLNDDYDNDGLKDGDEIKSGADPFNADTDGDGAPDGYDAHPLSTAKKTRKYYEWQYPEGNKWTLEIYVSYDLFDYESKLDRIRDWSKWSEYTLDQTSNLFAKELQKAANEKGYNYYQTINFVLSFVQSLPYTEDDVTTGGNEYPRYPLETLYEDGGDCEDTSILFSSILRQMNYDNCLVVLPGHMMTAVWGHDGYQGSYFTKNDKKYYFCETTGDGWKMGDLHPSFSSSQVKPYAVSVHSPITPPEASNYVFNPTDDAYIDITKPSMNFGDEYGLGVRFYKGIAVDELTYLLFDLDLPAGSTIKNAELKLYCWFLYNPTVVDIHRCSNVLWDESLITWDNAPTYSSTSEISQTINSDDTWYSWDVTNNVQDALSTGKITLVLKTKTNQGSLSFYPKTNTNAPELVIELS